MTIRTFLLAVFLLTAAACGPVTPPPSVLPTGPLPVDLTPPPPGSTEPAPYQATPAAQSAPVDAVSLEVLAPLDGAVLNTPQAHVSGRALPGEVITVNDEIILVGADGTFEAVVPLEEGPNLIEVIASNTSGSESAVNLLVTYQP